MSFKKIQYSEKKIKYIEKKIQYIEKKNTIQWKKIQYSEKKYNTVKKKTKQNNIYENQHLKTKNLKPTLKLSHQISSLTKV